MKSFRHRVLFRLLLSLPLFSCTTTDKLQKTEAAKPDVQNKVVEKAKDIQQSLAKILSCSDRVWPNMNWKEKVLILSNLDSQRAWLTDFNQDGRFQELPFKDLPIQFMGAHYGKGTYEDHPALSFNIGWSVDPKSDNRDFVINTIIHEAFHGFEQTDAWRVPDGDGERGSLFPIESRPRYLRYQIGMNTMKFLEGDSSALSAARYWSDLYKKEYPEEAKSRTSTDVLEGTAAYADAIGLSLLKNSCAAEEEALITSAVLGLKKSYPIGLDTETEPYFIQGMASLALRKKKVSGWEEKVLNGRPPLDLLLSDVSSRTQADDKAAKADIETRYGQMNKEALALIDPFLKAKSAADSVAILVDRNTLKGSYSARGFYRIKNPKLSLIAKYEGLFQSPDGKGSLKVTKMTLALSEAKKLCSFDDAYLLYVKSKDVEKNAELLNIRGEQVTAEKFPFKRGKDGKVLCLGEI